MYIELYNLIKRAEKVRFEGNSEELNELDSRIDRISEFLGNLYRIKMSKGLKRKFILSKSILDNYVRHMRKKAQQNIEPTLLIDFIHASLGMPNEYNLDPKQANDMLHGLLETELSGKSEQIIKEVSNKLKNLVSANPKIFVTEEVGGEVIDPEFGSGYILNFIHDYVDTLESEETTKGVSGGFPYDVFYNLAMKSAGYNVVGYEGIDSDMAFKQLADLMNQHHVFEKAANSAKTEANTDVSENMSIIQEWFGELPNTIKDRINANDDVFRKNTTKGKPIESIDESGDIARGKYMFAWMFSSMKHKAKNHNSYKKQVMINSRELRTVGSMANAEVLKRSYNEAVNWAKSVSSDSEDSEAFRGLVKEYLMTKWDFKKYEASPFVTNSNNNERLFKAPRTKAHVNENFNGMSIEDVYNKYGMLVRFAEYYIIGNRNREMNQDGMEYSRLLKKEADGEPLSAAEKRKKQEIITNSDFMPSFDFRFDPNTGEVRAERQSRKLNNVNSDIRSQAINWIVDSEENMETINEYAVDIAIQIAEKMNLTHYVQSVESMGTGEDGSYDFLERTDVSHLHSSDVDDEEDSVRKNRMLEISNEYIAESLYEQFKSKYANRGFKVGVVESNPVLKYTYLAMFKRLVKNIRNLSSEYGYNLLTPDIMLDDQMAEEASEKWGIRQNKNIMPMVEQWIIGSGRKSILGDVTEDINREDAYKRLSPDLTSMSHEEFFSFFDKCQKAEVWFQQNEESLDDSVPFEKYFEIAVSSNVANDPVTVEELRDKRKIDFEDDETKAFWKGVILDPELERIFNSNENDIRKGNGNDFKYIYESTAFSTYLEAALGFKRDAIPYISELSDAHFLSTQFIHFVANVKNADEINEYVTVSPRPKMDKNTGLNLEPNRVGGKPKLLSTVDSISKESGDIDMALYLGAKAFDAALYKQHVGIRGMQKMSKPESEAYIAAKSTYLARLYFILNLFAEGRATSGLLSQMEEFHRAGNQKTSGLKNLAYVLYNPSLKDEIKPDVLELLEEKKQIHDRVWPQILELGGGPEHYRKLEDTIEANYGQIMENINNGVASFRDMGVYDYRGDIIEEMLESEDQAVEVPVEEGEGVDQNVDVPEVSEVPDEEGMPEVPEVVNEEEMAPTIDEENDPNNFKKSSISTEDMAVFSMREIEFILKKCGF